MATGIGGSLLGERDKRARVNEVVYHLLKASTICLPPAAGKKKTVYVTIYVNVIMS